MFAGSTSRRRLLKGSVAVIPALATLAMAGRARAFSMETLRPTSGAALAYANRCSASDSTHAAIRSALQAELAGETGAPGATLTAREVCPICGCPIIVTRVVQ